MDKQYYLVVVRLMFFGLFFPGFSFAKVPVSVRILFSLSLAIFIFPLYHIDSSSPPVSGELIKQFIELFHSQPGEVSLEAGYGVFLAVICGAVFYGIAFFANWIIQEVFQVDRSVTQLVGQSSLELKVAFSVLVFSFLFQTVGAATLLEPLLLGLGNNHSVSQLAQNNLAASDSLGELGVSVMKFSFFIAVPFFVLLVLLDLTYFILQRLLKPIASSELYASLRAIVLILGLSLGALYIEYASGEFSHSWREQLGSTQVLR